MKERENEPLRICLLGGFQIRQGMATIGAEQFRLRKARDLVKLLALAPGQRLHREQLMEALWPDSEPKSAANSLHQTLFSTRQVLEGLNPPCRMPVENEWVCIRPEGALWVDVDAFRKAAQTALGGSDPVALRAAVHLYTGDLLPEDRYNEIINRERDEVRQTYLDLLNRIATHFMKRDEPGQAIEPLHKLVEADPTNEAAHAGLMRAYSLSGQRQQALRQYQFLQDALERELEIEPSPESQQLYAEILRSGRESEGAVKSSETVKPARITLQPPVPPGQPVVTPWQPAPKHNLPNAISSFIGRENEIAQVQALVLNARLVVLTGSGGVGKTRLALRAAEGMLDCFPDGTWLVELAPLSDPGLIAQEAASVLGVRGDSRRTILDGLIEYLHPRHLLLILDNCEHLVGGAAGLADALLRGCPGLRILATSREILGAAGETPFRVPSLRLPDLRDLPPLAELSHSEAVRLFVERAWSASPGFALNEANAATVARICQRLDGIPLAIELAAARVRLLSVSQIAARLDDVFHLLTSGGRTVLPRHQTLRALIDWSYNLLSPAERSLLQRLSVFAGSWTLEAAEFVCADAAAEHPQERNAGAEVLLPAEEILDLLGQLVDKSLVLTSAGSPAAGASGATVRYRMLETIRQYAHEQFLANEMPPGRGESRLVGMGEPQVGSSKMGELADEPQPGGPMVVRNRHLDYYLLLAEEAEPYLRGEHQVEWLDWLEAELDNLRLALEASLPNHVEEGLRLATALMWFSHIRYHWRENIGWLERLLKAEAVQRPALPPGSRQDRLRRLARARALQAIGFLLYIFGPREKAPPLLLESLEIYRELDLTGSKDYAISNFNLAKLDEDQKLTRIYESLQTFRAVGDDFYTAECLMDLGTYFASAGDVQQARQNWEENLALRRAIHDLDGEGTSLRFLGYMEYHLANYAQAEELYLKAMACYQAVGNEELCSFLPLDMGCIALVQGKTVQAIKYLEEARAASLKLDNIDGIVLSLCLLGWVDWFIGEPERAIVRCEEALRLHRKSNLPGIIDSGIYVLARVALTRGDYDQARAYLHRLMEIAADNWGRSGSIEALAVMACAQQQPRRGVMLFGAQSRLCSWLPNTHTPKERAEHEQALDAARSALEEDEFDAAWVEGQVMSMEEAMKEALMV